MARDKELKRGWPAYGGGTGAKAFFHPPATNPRQLRIGVSQGGALSGIIANLILNEADKVVKAEGVRLGAEIHYYRYCDDMLLISPSLQHCKLVFAAYVRKLTGLNLIYRNYSGRFDLNAA